MTAVATTASRTGRTRRTLKGVASILALLCLALFLLAIEQKQAVAAWDGIRHGFVPAAARAANWVVDSASDGVADLGVAVGPPPAAPFAAAGEDMVLTGDFGPADDATREAVGGVTFVAAQIRFESGETFHTRPLRIAQAREAFASGQTFAERWNAPPDAQVELRTITGFDGEQAARTLPPCGGAAAGAVALLHRHDRVDLMVFRGRAETGAETLPSDICGTWSFERR